MTLIEITWEEVARRVRDDIGTDEELSKEFNKEMIKLVREGKLVAFYDTIEGEMAFGLGEGVSKA